MLTVNGGPREISGDLVTMGVLEMEQKAGSDNVLYPIFHPFYMMPPRVSLDHTYIKSRPLLITTPNIYLYNSPKPKTSPAAGSSRNDS